MTEQQEREYALFVHLSGLVGLLSIPSVLGPLILWVIKKDASPFVDRHGRAAVNFHLSLLVYILVFVAVAVVLTVATLGLGLLLVIPLIIVGAIAVAILMVALPIIAGLKARDGQEYAYPITIRFLK